MAQLMTFAQFLLAAKAFKSVAKEESIDIHFYEKTFTVFGSELAVLRLANANPYMLLNKITKTEFNEKLNVWTYTQNLETFYTDKVMFFKNFEETSP